MYLRKTPVDLDCGLNLFLKVLSGKWKINLFWCIHSGIKRPSDIHRKLSTASRRVLDGQLTELDDHGIIKKITFEGPPLKVEYELTPLGQSLVPVIQITAQWGEDNREVLEKWIKFQTLASLYLKT